MSHEAVAGAQDDGSKPVKYSEMVMDAANALQKPRVGFSRVAIVKHIQDHYNIGENKVGHIFHYRFDFSTNPN